ncbi:hypothetical protein CEXT_713661 [Caerostris extrusa]|uniref:Uncharacterized protein n=1 Tax=Caerostris extrusa TaxID=172846 RepID=A0AAV4MWM3_CAEEX|nr:hypothetical protein CEXT_713661 [Caerostris extrusa]
MFSLAQKLPDLSSQWACHDTKKYNNITISRLNRIYKGHLRPRLTGTIALYLGFTSSSSLKSQTDLPINHDKLMILVTLRQKCLFTNLVDEPPLLCE